MKLYYSYTNFKQDIQQIAQEIHSTHPEIKYVYGLPRGGSIIAVVLSHILNLKYLTSLDEEHTPEKTIVVDDVSDSGLTLKSIHNINKYTTATLFIKEGTAFLPNIYTRITKRKIWIVYFWEDIK